MMKNIIFDCDPGIDDALAIMMAFADESINIKAITVVGGNLSVDTTLSNALELVSFLGKECIIAKGSSGPLTRPLVTAEEVHGTNGYGNESLPASKLTVSEFTANEVMHQILNKSDEKTIILATGPLTNVAKLFLTYPEDMKKVEYISIMGGACFGGNQSPSAEFNIQVDPESAKIVFESGVPIVLHALDVTTKAYCTQEEIEIIRNIGTTVSDFTANILDFYMDFHKSVGFDVIHMHDLAAFAYIASPDMFSGKMCNVEVETKGEITYGATVVDYNNTTGKKQNVNFMWEVDRERFVDKFISAIKSYK